LADLVLLILTLCWGTSFALVKEALGSTSPGVLLSARFSIAFLALALIWAIRRPRLTPGFWRDGLLLGLFMLAGFVTQTVGLRYTTPARSGFITGLNVLVVPVIACFFLGRRVRPAFWLGTSFALAGLVLLARPFSDSAIPAEVQFGDLLTFACALANGLQVTFTSEWAPRHPLVPFVAVQVGVTLAGSLLMLPVEGVRLDLAALGRLVPVVTYLGLVMTAGAFFLMNWGQRHTTAVRAALIFALEPAAAAVFSWLYLGEPLGPLDWAGGGLMVVGVVVGELGGLFEARRGARVATEPGEAGEGTA
jgi:drug/metabolite transporter (DMT)-like permease